MVDVEVTEVPDGVLRTSYVVEQKDRPNPLKLETAGPSRAAGDIKGNLRESAEFCGSRFSTFYSLRTRLTSANIQDIPIFF